MIENPNGAMLIPHASLFYFYADKKDSATFEKMMSGLEDIYSAIVEKLLKIQ